MTMLPFDLDKALSGYKVIMKNGNHVSEIFRTKGGDHLVALYYPVNRDIPVVSVHDLMGRSYFNCDRCDQFDLMMSPPSFTMKKYYKVIFLFNGGRIAHESALYESPGEAMKAIRSTETTIFGIQEVEVKVFDKKLE